jgi:hypothetical protein
MFWSTINIDAAGKMYLPTFLRRQRTTAFFDALLAPLQSIANETLYKMQHNGTKIYLEKVLNEAYRVTTYNAQNHEDTKLIYIEDVDEPERLFIYQDEELGVTFIEDDGEELESDIFLDNEDESSLGYSWIIYMPDTISFNEFTLRALVDSYRYIGKNYIIQIYTP